MKEKKYDIVVIDINMPILDGFETIRKLKILYENIFIQTFIIGMSNDSDEETSEKSLKSGMDCFLEKPFTIKKFNEFISKFSKVYNLRVQHTSI
jgi:CheY-like chemotaxis protein